MILIHIQEFFIFPPFYLQMVELICDNYLTNVHFQVPSDEDSVAEKRKGEELVVPEGNKKKKKQVNTPRPACSWVHFR